MNENINENEILLSEKEVWDIVAFARSAYGIYGSGILTPELVSGRMKDIALNPMAATEATLEDALLDPKNSETNLQGFSENFELQSMPYKRLLSYLSSMLSFDLTYTCTNAEEEDYKTSAYKRDLAIVESFLEKFDYKKEFAVATKEMLRNETFFCLPRFDGKKIVLQELPASPEYTKITGRWDHGFLMSFSLYWFILPGVDINMYPSFFKKKYDEIFGSGSGVATQRYIPSLPPSARGDSSWVYWIDIPVDLGWVFKLDTSLAARVPYFSPLFSDLVLQALMRNLQKNINMSVASRMIMGEVPLLKDTKASIKDMISMSPDLLGKFLALVKSAISESVKVASAPLENIQGISFDSENELYDSFLRTSLASSGVNSNLIFSSNIKPNITETRLSLEADEQMMYMNLYPQFNDFLNYNVNKFTKKYKWSFEFEGTNFFTNRTDRFERAMTLADKGIVLPQKIAASIGMKPHIFMRQIEESRAMGFVDMLTPIISGFQMGKEDAGGRPQKKEGDLSESGEQTRNDGGNLERGGKI